MEHIKLEKRTIGLLSFGIIYSVASALFVAYGASQGAFRGGFGSAYMAGLVVLFTAIAWGAVLYAIWHPPVETDISRRLNFIALALFSLIPVVFYLTYFVEVSMGPVSHSSIPMVFFVYGMFIVAIGMASTLFASLRRRWRSLLHSIAILASAIAFVWFSSLLLGL